MSQPPMQPVQKVAPVKVFNPLAGKKTPVPVGGDPSLGVRVVNPLATKKPVPQPTGPTTLSPQGMFYPLSVATFLFTRAFLLAWTQLGCLSFPFEGTWNYGLFLFFVEFCSPSEILLIPLKILVPGSA